MLVDTLKSIHEAEEKADNILAKANQTVQEIEQQTYQKIAEIQATTETAIATAISQLPLPAPVPPESVTLNVSADKIKAAVDYVVQACTEV